jgi:hypothetical protein
MRRFLARVRYEIRWLKWLFSGPNPGEAVINKVDLRSYEIMLDRHDAREPDFHGTYPHRKGKGATR